MFYTNKENKDYLNFTTFGLYMLMGKKTPKIVSDEIGEMFSAIIEYEKETKWSIGEMTISKDSVLGSYVIRQSNGVMFRDASINMFDISNAFNIAIYEDNPISKDIYPLFKNQVSGTIKTLSKKYDEKLINYILDNNDFEYYLNMVNGDYEPKEYKVYEGKCFKKKKLVQNVKELQLRRNEK